MAQLMMTHDVNDSPFLREHLEEKIADIETVLPEGTPLTVHVKRVAKGLFATCLRVRLFGRELVVRAYDTNLIQAMNRASRHLLRQVDDARQFKRDQIRHRPGRGRAVNF